MSSHPSTSPVAEAPSRSTRSPAPRHSVVTGLLAGALLVAVPPLEGYVAGDFFLLLPVALVLMLAALPGLRRHQGGGDEPLGSVGLRMVNLGLLVSIVTVVLGSMLLDALPSAVQDVAEPLLMLVAGIAAVAAVAGLVMLTLGMFRAAVYPKVAIALFGPGLVLALLSEVAEQSISGTIPTVLDILPPALFLASGVGLLGIALAAQRTRW